MREAQSIINDLKQEGYNTKQIKDFLCDGEALKAEGYTDQAVIEEAYNLIIEESDQPTRSELKIYADLVREVKNAITNN